MEYFIKLDITSCNFLLTIIPAQITDPVLKTTGSLTIARMPVVAIVTPDKL